MFGYVDSAPKNSSNKIWTFEKKFKNIFKN